MAKFYVDANGVYLGAFDGCARSVLQNDGSFAQQDFFPTVPDGAVEVSSAPVDARQTWANGAWSDPALLPKRPVNNA